MADDQDDLDRALGAARERGRLRAVATLNGKDMVSSEAFAERPGISPGTLSTKLQRREVLALEGASGGFRFPAWQVDQDGQPFAALARLFELLGDSPWAVYRFLVQRHPELDGASAQDALRRGRADLVIEAAEGLAHGTFA